MTKVAELSTEIVQGLENFFKAGGGLTELATKVKGLSDRMESLNGFSPAEFLKQLQQQKAVQDQMAGMIRRSRHGLYVSGIEDQGFSLLKTVLGIKAGGRKEDFEKLDAGHEFELLKSVYNKHGERMGWLAKGQSVGNDKLGGAWVPDQVIADVIPAIYADSIFIALDANGKTTVSVVDGVTGLTATVPKFEGGMVAYWVGEEDAYAESAISGGDETVSMCKLGVLAKVTAEMEASGGFGWESLFRNDMIRAMAAKLDYAIPFGKGGRQPRGILQTPGVKIFSAQSKKHGVLGTDSLSGALFQADWQGATLDFDGLDEMDLILEEDKIRENSSRRTYGPKRFFRNLARLKVQNFDTQTTNFAYMLGAPMIPDAKVAQLIGEFSHSPMFSTTDKPGASIGAPTTSVEQKCATVIRGNMSEVVVVRGVGLEITDDAGKGTGFASDAKLIKAKLMVGEYIRQPRALIGCPDAKVRV